MCPLGERGKVVCGRIEGARVVKIMGVTGIDFGNLT